MVKTMAKLRMAHASTHGTRKPHGPKKQLNSQKFKIEEEKNYSPKLQYKSALVFVP